MPPPSSTPRSVHETPASSSSPPSAWPSVYLPGPTEVRPEVLEQTWNNYQPGTRRPYGLMEWPALLRMLDRRDPSYAD